MPLYEYQCRACSKVTEVRHGFREPYDGSCPQCGGDMARVFNPAGIVFKGSGFYINDSRKPAASESSAGSGSGSDSSSTATPAAPAAPAASSSSDAGPKKSESAA